MKKKTQRSYICPFCRKKNTSILQWQTISAKYEYDLVKCRYSDILRTEGGDIECWACSNCEHELSRELVKKLGLE